MLVGHASAHGEDGSRIALPVEQLLPLAHHAETGVVDDDERDRQLVLDGHDQLLKRHLRTTVAADGHSRVVRPRDRRADGGGNAKTHRAHAARGEEVAREVVAEKLGGPHLVLSHVRHDHGPPLRSLVHGLDDGLRHDHVRVHRLIGDGVLLLPFRDLREPVCVFSGLDTGVDRGEHVFDVGDDAEVHGHVLTNARRIAVHMYYLRTFRVGGELAGHAVGEPHAEGDQEVGRVDRVVRGGRTVHAGEAKRERVVFVERPEPHERGCHGNLRLVRKVRHVVRRTAGDHAAARVDHGTLRLVDEFRETRHLRGCGHGLWVVGAERYALGILRRGKPSLHVLRDVDHDGTGLAVRGDVERLGDGLGNLVRALHEEAVLRDGAADAVHVRLLEGVRADLVHRDLSRNAHERHAVHVGGRKAGDRVRGAGSGGDEAHAGLALRAGVAVGHVYAPLLVPSEDELERRFREAVEDVKGLPARIAEQHLRARLRKRIHERLRASCLLFILLLHFLFAFCCSHACAFRSPRAARDRIFHSSDRRSSAFTPFPSW